MKIQGSQLRMDATSGHRDVRVTNEWTGVFEAPGSDRNGSSFSLPRDREGFRERQDSAGGRSSPPLTSRSQFMFEHHFDYLEFQSAGEVTSADGRTIEFSLDLSISRQQTSVSLGAGALPWLIDPLVLSFDNTVSLSPDSFAFDLDGDGGLERIAGLNEETGFLALDRNGDGQINSGIELFGPTSGTGFAELAAFDFDENGWIDESDPVFGELLVWFAAGGEEERLVSLKDAGVGALALASTETSFALKDSRGVLLGEVTRAGLFFMESGEARSLQELDLSLYPPGQEVALRPKPLVTMADAMALLHQMIVRRQQQVASLLLRASGGRREEVSLVDKFWRWQDQNRDEERVAADLLARRTTRLAGKS